VRQLRLVQRVVLERPRQNVTDALHGALEFRGLVLNGPPGRHSIDSTVLDAEYTSEIRRTW
jgi:hypothetical protein